MPPSSHSGCGNPSDWLDSVQVAVNPGYRGLLGFCELSEEQLEPHERKIARAHFGEAREVCGPGFA